MKRKRKVYIASGLPQGEINKRFKHLDGMFERTATPDKAEFMIVDLSDKHDEWPRMVGFRSVFYIPSHNVPFLFVAFDKLDDSVFSQVRKALRCDPPVYRTPEDLLNALAWFESAMPFYIEEDRNDQLAKEVTSFVLSQVKS